MKILTVKKNTKWAISPRDVGNKVKSNKDQWMCVYDRFCWLIQFAYAKLIGTTCVCQIISSFIFWQRGKGVIFCHIKEGLSQFFYAVKYSRRLAKGAKWGAGGLIKYKSRIGRFQRNGDINARTTVSDSFHHKCSKLGTFSGWRLKI
jgi:hypothetical protein